MAVRKLDRLFSWCVPRIRRSSFRTIAVCCGFAVMVFASHAMWPDPAQSAGEPNDPYFSSKGTWGQDFDDQWALKRIGFTSRGNGQSAWDLAAGANNPVIVAVIDTGLDYFHPDLNKQNVWRNTKETENGVDDDGNGYVDDLIGWNFIDDNNNPWDRAGHGTHTAGVIAAATGNGEGIAGINPSVKIMPLKVLNFLGRGRSTGIAEAIFYAVENGARIINLSLGGEYITQVEKKAVAYANKRGVLVVVASGNAARSTSDYGFASLPSVITVAATDEKDRRAQFSNWGPDLKLAAPGVEILSLRARQTDFVLIARFMGGTKKYKAKTAFVGPENKYYRASGTSFAAPFVSGVASVLLAKNPGLTAEQVARMILQSAKDIEEPGVDQFTGFGLLDARAALKADPDYYLTAKVRQVAPTRVGGQTVVQVFGTAVGSSLKNYEIQLGQGPKPKKWKTIITEQQKTVENNLLGNIPIKAITARGQWTIRLVVQDGKNTREARGTLNVN